MSDEAPTTHDDILTAADVVPDPNEPVLDVAPATDPLAPAPPEPVAAPERLGSVDVLRGFALLGILAMNIISFGWPFPVYENPTLGGGFNGANRVAWLINEFVFAGKMMTTFSMLFGAGLVLMADRAAARGASALKVYYRRVLWLLVFGLVHAYLIWEGDILYTYAVCGLLLYPFRARSPRTLIIVGVLVALVPAAMGLGMAGFFAMARQGHARAEAAKQAGKTPDEFDEGMHQAWSEIRSEMEGSPKELAQEITTYRDGYPGIVAFRAGRVFAMQTVFFLLFLGWMALGRMLLGMGLMKLGVFAAARSDRFYRNMILLGYGTGLPLTALGVYHGIKHHFRMTEAMACGMVPIYLGTIPVALGHAGVVMLICKTGALTGLTRRLAAVGRMALTNYLMHSLICTTIFYGYGLGYFARVERVGLYAIVVAIWVLQLLVSPIWLTHFRFGPAEWLWRSLTYGKPQPMRQPIEVVPA